MSNFATHTEEEDFILPMETLQQRDFVPSAQGQLAVEIGEASEGSEEMTGYRSEFRNVVVGGSGEEGNGDSDEDLHVVSQEDTKSLFSEWLCMQRVGVARMMAVIMMDTLKTELGLTYMKAAEDWWLSCWLF